MFYVRNLLLLSAISCFIGLAIGLVKPWIMLWWEDVQNRKKVVRLYGTLGILFLAAYYLLAFI
jgi:hypothetical protein